MSIIKQKSCLETSEGIINYTLFLSSKRKTISISVDGKANVCVSAPKYASKKYINKFILEKALWIKKKIFESKKNLGIINTKKYEKGQKFLFLGKKYELFISEESIGKAKIVFDQFKWQISIPKGLNLKVKQKLIKEKLIKWYRDQALEVLGCRLFHYSRIMEVEPKKIAIRTHKRIWGNCDHRSRTIHLNWQIILAPIDIVDYVVVHELCHFFQPNHSKYFWAEVEAYLPDYKRRKLWLKSHHFDMILP